MLSREIEDRIKADWPDSGDALLLARAIANLEPKASVYITLPMMQRMLARKEGGLRVGLIANLFFDRLADFGIPPLFQHVHRLAEYLASERVRMLEAHFELLDKDNALIELAIPSIVNALRTGDLYHPDTGERVDNWSSHVTIYYRRAST